MSKLVFDDGKIRVFHGRCEPAMEQMPDKAFSLALVDPPYGIGIANNPVRQKHTKKGWDSATPSADYYRQLFRVTGEQIIWGGNYFDLPPTQGFIIWDKKQPQDFSLAMCEFAWMSIQKPAKIFRYSVLTEGGKIHPTQKPVKLYKWLLTNYAKSGDTILDTHMGSGSLLIACHDLGFSIDAYERDEEYCTAAVERLKRHQSQQSLFRPTVDSPTPIVGAQTQLQLTP